MKAGNQIKWIALGLTPMMAGFFWQILASIVVIVIYMICKRSEPAAAMTEILEGNGSSYGILMVVINIGYLLMFGLWYGLMFVKRQKHDNWKQVLKPVRIGGLLLCGIGIQLFLTMALMVIFSFMPMLEEQYKIVSDMIGSNSVFMILCVSILAPIGEELMFRGVIMQMMEKAVPWQAAIVVQAILFGIYHMNLIQGVYATLLGLIFGYVVHRYRSVVPGILLHMAVNSFSYGMIYLFPAKLEESILWQIILCVVGLGTTIVALWMYLKDVQREN